MLDMIYCCHQSHLSTNISMSKEYQAQTQSMYYFLLYVHSAQPPKQKLTRTTNYLHTNIAGKALSEMSDQIELFIPTVLD